MQQRALGSGRSWQTEGGHPKGNSFSSGAGWGLLAELEAIPGSKVGQRSGPAECAGREEVCSSPGHPLW